MFSVDIPQDAVFALETVLLDQIAPGRSPCDGCAASSPRDRFRHAPAAARIETGGSNEEGTLARAHRGRFVDLVSQGVKAAQEPLTSPLKTGLARTSTLAETVVGLGETVEGLLEQNSAHAAIDDFRREMTCFVARLDEADRGIASLKSLERTIEALLEGLGAAAETGVPTGLHPEPSLAQELAGLRKAQEETRRRLDAGLATIVSTLEKSADRLSRLESVLRESCRMVDDVSAPILERSSRRRSGRHGEGRERRPTRVQAEGTENGEDPEIRKTWPGSHDLTEILMEPGSGAPRAEGLARLGGYGGSNEADGPGVLNGGIEPVPRRGQASRSGLSSPGERSETVPKDGSRGLCREGLWRKVLGFLSVAASPLWNEPRHSFASHHRPLMFAAGLLFAAGSLALARMALG